MYKESVGYRDCVACGDVAFVHPLCEWCKLGAAEYNDDPDSVFDDDFQEGSLILWREAGERIAEEEQQEADEKLCKI